MYLEKKMILVYVVYFFLFLPYVVNVCCRIKHRMIVNLPYLTSCLSRNNSMYTQCDNSVCYENCTFSVMTRVFQVIIQLYL